MYQIFNQLVQIVAFEDPEMSLNMYTRNKRNIYGLLCKTNYINHSVIIRKPAFITRSTAPEFFYFAAFVVLISLWTHSTYNRNIPWVLRYNISTRSRIRMKIHLVNGAGSRRFNKFPLLFLEDHD